MEETSLKDLQKVCTKILFKFVDVCEEYHLRYYLCGGTCLGAYRGQGFIPWDDDVDVMMPYSDYLKLQEVIQPFLDRDKDNHYFAQTSQTDPNFLYCYMKIRDSETTFVEKTFQHLSMNHGVYIDIFPLTGLTPPSVTKVRFRDLLRLYKGYIYFFISYFAHLGRPVKLRTCYKDIPANIVGFLFKPWNYHNRINKKVLKMTEKYSFDEAHFVGCYHDFEGSREFWKREWFDGTTPLMFEGRELQAPKDTKAYLSFLYGETYMTPPKNQEPRHITSETSLIRPYTDYLKRNNLPINKKTKDN